MPIARIGSKLVYFAHVPKCAGSAVERYLEQRFGPLAFRDPAFYEQEHGERWTNSSPQHIPIKALTRLFPASFFDVSFAVIRHPVDRLASAFLYQREIEETIASDTSLEDWLEYMPTRRQETPFAFDNHTRPMSDFIPEDSLLFRLEDGLNPVVAWLDDFVGMAEGPREILPFNVLNTRLANEARPPVALKVDQSARDLIATLYHEDFERFGYDPSAETHY